LSVEGVTLSAVALAAETGRQLAHGGAVLHVAPGVAELAIHHGGQPRALRHLRAHAPAAAGAAVPMATPADGAPPAAGAETSPESPRLSEAATALTPELRQVLSLMPQNGSAAPTELVVWDGVGLGDATRHWADLLHVDVRARSIDSLGVTVASDAGDGVAGGGRYAPAVALALEGLRTGGVITDLLHSRLVPKKERRVGRWTVWAAVLGITFVGAIAFAAYDLSSQRREVADAKSRLDALQPQVKEAQAAIDRTTFAQRWTGTDPKALSLLRDVTMAFPEGGRVWATSLILQPDGRVTLTGRATSDQAPGDLFARLRASKKFTDVQLGNTGGANQRGGGNETQFTITFRYPGI
jgi:Tfp pilus assembly protein PilN